MKITVTGQDDQIFVLDVAEDLELENFKVFCEVESGIPADRIYIAYNGQLLGDHKRTLKDYGIVEGDVVVIVNMPQGGGTGGGGGNAATLASGVHPQSFGSDSSAAATAQPNVTIGNRPLSVGDEDDPKLVRDLLLTNPDQLALLKQNNPRLADALLSGNLDTFASVLREQIRTRTEKQEQRIKLMQAGPFDAEAQKLIAEEIRQKNIEANMEAAMEYNPEAFGTVVMLYINCRVNGVPVKAFIDSGAQTTIMSANCAERCSISRLVDTRWSGIAKGVGVQKIIGRIHMVQLQIEQDFLITSFSVLEEQPMDMLLGLDMLKRHQCNIDLQKNVLRIGTTGTETPFLPENVLPECARLSGTASEDEAKALEESMKLAEQKSIQEALARSKSGSSDGAGPSSSASSTGVPSSSAVPMDVTETLKEDDVREIINLGFSREQAVAELSKFNGDKKMASASLFAKSLQF